MTVLVGRALLFTPRAFRRRNIEDASSAIGHIFQGLLFLLASGESLGLAAVTAAALGVSTAWEASTVCLWQVLVGLALTPDRGHWDRLLSAWDRAHGKGGSDHVS